MQTPHTRQEELGSLFAAVDQARRSLARLDQERAQLLEEIARLNAAADQAQQALSPAERAAAHAAYLAIALARVDEEMRARAMAR